MKKIHDFLAQNNSFYSTWHNYRHSTLVNLLILTICTSITATALTYTINNTVDAYEEEEAEERYSAIQQDRSTVNEKTKDLLNLVYQYSKSSTEERPGLLIQLVNAASIRRNLVTRAMEKNPQDILDGTIESSLLVGIPNEIKNLIEEKKTIKGKFSHVHMDFFDQDLSIEEYYIEDSSTKNKYKINFTDKKIPAKTDDIISITGYALGGEIAANSEDVQMLTEATASPTTMKKAVVIMFNWQNDTRTSFTEASARGAFFTNPTSANNYFKENSFGKMGLTGKVRTDGDVYGWFTIPYDNTNCSSNWSVWGPAADAEAQKKGIDLSGYDIKTYVFPNNSSCGWAGLGYMSGSPARSWINTTAISTIIHELGHNIGTHHASSYSCTENSVRVPISNTCTVSEYGDPYDVMGISNTRHMNIYHKGRTGTYAPNWLTSSNTLTINRSTSPDDTYTIAPLEQLSSGIQSLRIPRTTTLTGGVSDYYYLEFRQPFGFDNFATTSTVTNGVTIRIAPDYGTNVQSKLIDTTPETTSFVDAPLAVNKMFTDTQKAITINTVSVSPAGAEVRVSFGSMPCVNYAPTISISPGTQSGAAGQTLSYNVTVKNNDASDCTTSNFSISPTLPTGLIQSPTSLTTGLLSPGASITKIVNITSTTSTPTGNKSFTQKATHQNNTTLTSNVSGVYSVIAPDSTIPTITINKPVNGSKVSSKGSLSISTSATDAGGVSKIEIYIDSSIIKTCSNTTSCSINYKTSNIASGIHTITAKAHDSSGNIATASVLVTK